MFVCAHSVSLLRSISICFLLASSCFLVISLYHHLDKICCPAMFVSFFVASCMFLYLSMS